MDVNPNTDSVSQQCVSNQASPPTPAIELPTLNDPHKYCVGIKNQLPQISQQLRARDRADSLPALFRFKGQPYSLDDYPQFKTMYDYEMVPDTLWICGRQGGKCEVGTTPVSLRNGKTVKLQDIQVGDEVLSKDQHCHIGVRRVTAKFDHGVKDLIRIRTSMGSTLDLTREHRLYTLLGYKCAGLLKVGDRLATPRRGGEFMDKPMPQDRIALTAYLIGDGCCRG